MSVNSPLLRGVTWRSLRDYVCDGLCLASLGLPEHPPFWWLWFGGHLSCRECQHSAQTRPIWWPLMAPTIPGPHECQTGRNQTHGRDVNVVKAICKRRPANHNYLVILFARAFNPLCARAQFALILHYRMADRCPEPRSAPADSHPINTLCLLTKVRQQADGILLTFPQKPESDIKNHKRHMIHAHFCHRENNQRSPTYY